MNPQYVKMEKEEQKSILDYISLSTKEDSSSKILPSKIDTPKISLIIPLYNSEKTLIPLINSIQNQTLKELEIILINDNSSDKTESLLTKLKKEDTRIITITNKIRRGVLFNIINTGLQAKGEYIIFLYQDDFFTSNDVLEKLYDIATKKFEEKIDTVNYRICISLYNKEQIESLNYIPTVNLNNVNKILKSPDIFLNYFQKKRDITESRFIFDKMYKRELIQKAADLIGPQIWNQILSFGYDFLFAFAVMKQCNSFINIKDICYCHKIKDESTMWEIDGDRLKYNDDSNKKIGDYMLVLERMLQLTENEKDNGEFRENILKELIEEKYLKSIARSIFYDKFITLFEKIYNWKYADKDTKKRAKENIKTIISYKIESGKKFINLLAS
jgi:glycosyltransferase involved in cell wall biosynthesis